MSLTKDYYDVLDPYLPEEARSVLHNQRDIIEEKIATQIEGFASSLQSQIEAEMTKEIDAMDKDLRQALTDVETMLNGVSAANPQQLQAATSRLKTAVAAQRQAVQSYGEKIKSAAIVAARSAGLPFI